MPILRVWIVTSDEDLERRWTAALQERSHIVLLGTARQTRDAAELDVVLLDRPDDDEVREVTKSHPTAYIVAAGDTLEVRDDAQTVCRDLPARTLVRGLEWLYGPRTVLALVMGFAAEHRLAPQEVRVIYGTLLGFDRFQIAEELAISPDTVSSYWSRIFTKTGIHGRVEVIAAVVHTQVASDLVTSRLAYAHALAYLSSLFRGRGAHARAATTSPPSASTTCPTAGSRTAASAARGRATPSRS